MSLVDALTGHPSAARRRESGPANVHRVGIHHGPQHRLPRPSAPWDAPFLLGTPFAQGPNTASAAATASARAGDGREDRVREEIPLEPQAQAATRSPTAGHAPAPPGTPGVAAESARLSTGVHLLVSALGDFCDNVSVAPITSTTCFVAARRLGHCPRSLGRQRLGMSGNLALPDGACGVAAGRRP